MATPRKRKRTEARREFVPAYDLDSPVPELDRKGVVDRLAEAWGVDGFLAWFQYLGERLRDLDSRLPVREPLSAAERTRLIADALAGVTALRELIHHLGDDTGLVTQIFHADHPGAAILRLDGPLFEWRLLLSLAASTGDHSPEAQADRDRRLAHLRELEMLEAKTGTLPEHLQGRAVMLYAGLAPAPRVPTPRAMPAAVLAMAREIADDARLRPILPGATPVRATASRDGWFVLVLEWVIERAQLHRYGVTSAAALADKALAP